MNKRILGGLAVAAMLAGGFAITSGVASATDEAPVEETPTEAVVEIPEAVLEAPSEGAHVQQVNEGVCPLYTTGHESANNQKVWTYTAPSGKIILKLCVKAGSVNNDNGPEEVAVGGGVTSITFSHSSDKEISHFSVKLGDGPPPPVTTVPSTTTPVTTVPSTTTPVTTVPSTTTPVTTVPSTTTPVTTVPSTTTPVTTVPSTEVVVALPPPQPPTAVVAALPPTQAPTTTAPAPVATIPAAGLPATGSNGTGVAALIALLVTSLGGAALLAARRRNVTT